MYCLLEVLIGAVVNTVSESRREDILAGGQMTVVKYTTTL